MHKNMNIYLYNIIDCVSVYALYAIYIIVYLLTLGNICVQNFIRYNVRFL